jgi:hypothetical protein
MNILSKYNDGGRQWGETFCITSVTKVFLASSSNLRNNEYESVCGIACGYIFGYLLVRQATNVDKHAEYASILQKKTFLKSVRTSAR